MLERCDSISSYNRLAKTVIMLVTDKPPTAADVPLNNKQNRQPYARVAKPSAVFLHAHAWQLAINAISVALPPRLLVFPTTSSFRTANTHNKGTGTLLQCSVDSV
jgi:hypothetical protein